MFGKSRFSRRDFLKTTAALGLGGAMSSSLLAACAPAGPAPAGAPAAEGGAAGPSGSVTIALHFDLQSLDPIKTFALNNGRWQKNVFGYLIKRDEEMNPVPGGGLALSWEQEDDLNVVFKLREGVKFHNGEDFNADAVVYSFERLLDEANASPQRFNYTAIDRFEKVDDYTVRMTLNEVDPVIITKLAGYGGAIVPPQFVEEQGADYVSATDIPGTGPYQIVEYRKDDSLTLEAFDGYWGEAPKIKTLVYRIIPDEATRLAEFLAGGVDVVQLQPSQVAAVEGSEDLEVFPTGVPTVNGLRLDASKPPTDNVKVRAAICHAIDTQTVIDTILQGYAVPMAVWQSPYSFGYDPELQPYAYDPDLAKQLLAESGVADPTLVYNVIGDDATAKEIANTVAAMLEAVGFTVTIAQKERPPISTTTAPARSTTSCPSAGAAGHWMPTTPTIPCTTPVNPTTPASPTRRSARCSTNSAARWTRNGAGDPVPGQQADLRPVSRRHALPGAIPVGREQARQGLGAACRRAAVVRIG